MNWNELGLLRFLDTYTTPGGADGVGRNAIAGWFGCTSPTAAKRIEPLIGAGFVEAFKIPLKRGYGYKWHYAITAEGYSYVSANWDACMLAYEDAVDAKLAALLERVKRVSVNRGKLITRRAQIEAGQKRLF